MNRIISTYFGFSARKQFKPHFCQIVNKKKAGGGGNCTCWPGVYEGLHRCSEEQDHTGAAEGCSALFLLLHRVTSLQVWIHKPQGEPVGVFPLQTDGTRERQCIATRHKSRQWFAIINIILVWYCFLHKHWHISINSGLLIFGSIQESAWPADAKIKLAEFITVGDSCKKNLIQSIPLLT